MTTTKNQPDPARTSRNGTAMLQTMSLLSHQTPPGVRAVPPHDRPAVVYRSAAGAPGNGVVAHVFHVDGVHAAEIAAEIAALPELIRLREAVLSRAAPAELWALALRARADNCRPATANRYQPTTTKEPTNGRH